MKRYGKIFSYQWNKEEVGSHQEGLCYHESNLLES